MNKILLDTQVGDYLCYACSLPIGPDREQVILGHWNTFQVVCRDCLEEGEVVISYTKLGFYEAS